MRHYTILALAALLLGSSLSSFAVDVHIGGYVQGRYDDIAGGPDTNNDTKYSNDKNATQTFSLRRARINATATLTKNASAVIEIDTTKGVSDTLMYVNYGLPQVNFSLGRKRDPFNYELSQSSSTLTTLERSVISQHIAPEYATGLYISPDKSIVPFPVTLAFLNVYGDNSSSTWVKNGVPQSALYSTDDTHHKLALLTAETPDFYGAHIGGTYTTDGALIHAYNAYARGTMGPASLQAEYMHSKNLDENGITQNSSDSSLLHTPKDAVNRGYYILGSYAVTSNLTGYARYDDATVTSTSDATYLAKPVHDATIGANLMLADGAKWTVEYSYIHDRNNPSKTGIYPLHDGLATQLQIKF